jgi:hypothetical protein
LHYVFGLSLLERTRAWKKWFCCVSRGSHTYGKLTAQRTLPGYPHDRLQRRHRFEKGIILLCAFSRKQHRTHTDHVPENLALMRRMALNLIRRNATGKRSIRRHRNLLWLMISIACNYSQVQHSAIALMSGVVAHKLYGFHTIIPRRYRDETGRMVTGDSENEIRRSVWRLAERAFKARRSGAVAVGVCERTFRRYIDRYEDEGLIDKRLNQVSHRRVQLYLGEKPAPGGKASAGRIASGGNAVLVRV